jgi:hypothetical protein
MDHGRKSRDSLSGDLPPESNRKIAIVGVRSLEIEELNVAPHLINSEQVIAVMVNPSTDPKKHMLSTGLSPHRGWPPPTDACRPGFGIKNNNVASFSLANEERPFAPSIAMPSQP